MEEIVKYLGNFHPVILHLPIGAFLFTLLLFSYQKFTKISLTIPIRLGLVFSFISAIVSLVIYYEVSNVNFSSDEPNKDKLLVDLVSYVLDKLHYDPKIINDNFSTNVYDDFIDAVDSQKRFLLNSDIELFSQYRLLIDDQINSSDIAFFKTTSQLTSFFDL